MRQELLAKRDALVANYGEQRDALLADLLPEARLPPEFWTTHTRIGAANISVKHVCCHCYSHCTCCPDGTALQLSVDPKCAEVNHLVLSVFCCRGCRRPRGTTRSGWRVSWSGCRCSIAT